MDSLERNKTWDLVEIPEDKRVVSWKWVSKLKNWADDKDWRNKSRLVENKYSQSESIDFHEMFSPFAKLVSICVVLELVGLLDLELE